MDFTTAFLTVIIGWISVPLGIWVSKRWFLNQIAEFANNYIAQMLEDVVKNPEKLKPVLDALVQQGMTSLGASKANGDDSIRFGRWKIPQWAVQLFLPRVQAELAKTGKEAVKEAARGF